MIDKPTDQTSDATVYVLTSLPPPPLMRSGCKKARKPYDQHGRKGVAFIRLDSQPCSSDIQCWSLPATFQAVQRHQNHRA